jgi:hypothetical protein
MRSPAPSRRALIFLVVGALVVPAILLSVLALSLLRQIETLGRRSLGEYGDYLAELSISHAEQELWDDEQRLMVATRADPPRDMNEVAALLAELSRNPFYRLVFWVRPDRSTAFPNAVPWEDRTSAPVLRALEPVAQSLADEWQGPAPLHHVDGEDGGRPFQVTFFTLRSWQDEVLGSVVLVWNLDHLDRQVLPRLFAGGPPQGKAVFRAGYLRDHTGLCLLDRDGHVIYESGPERAAPFIASLPFRRVLRFYRLAVRLEDAEFQSWMRRVRTTHLALISAMLLIVLLGGLFLIRWINREMELAALKSHLVSSVSHELKTPIALIRLYAETLEMGRVREPERMQEFLEIISRETQRLTHLINNVLDVSPEDLSVRHHRSEPCRAADPRGLPLPARSSRVSTRAVDRSRPARCTPGSRGDHSGVHQPARQRDQVLGRGGAEGDRCDARPAGTASAPFGARSRDRHRAGRGAPDLRPLLSRAGSARREREGLRARAHAREPHRDRPWRPGAGEVASGRRRHLHSRIAARAGGRVRLGTSPGASQGRERRRERLRLEERWPRS